MKSVKEQAYDVYFKDEATDLDNIVNFTKIEGLSESQKTELTEIIMSAAYRMYNILNPDNKCILIKAPSFVEDVKNSIFKNKVIDNLEVRDIK